MKFFTAFVSAVSAATVVKRSKHDDQHISTELKFEQTLRICNAYPFAVGGVEVLDTKIAYKNCADISKGIKANQQIDFHTLDKSVVVGTFEINELPANDALLLLVIQPHDEVSTGVKFQSHAFSNSDDPQVALLDAHVGTGGSEPAKLPMTLTIEDSRAAEAKDAGAARKEELQFDSVVAIQPGSYEVALKEAKSKKHVLTAGAGKKYSIVRVGVRPADSAQMQYPDDIVVFPTSAASALYSVMGALLAVIGFNVVAAF
jgi:predicted  nucleic acid-binding Zn-ribbon protein